MELLFIHSFILKSVITGRSSALGASFACPLVGHAAVNVLKLLELIQEEFLNSVNEVEPDKKIRFI